MQMWTQRREAIGSPVLGGGGAAAPTAGLAGGELPPTISSRVLSPFLLCVPQGPGVPDLTAKGGQGWRHVGSKGGEVGTGGKGRMVAGEEVERGKAQKGAKAGVFSSSPPCCWVGRERDGSCRGHEEAEVWGGGTGRGEHRAEGNGRRVRHAQKAEGILFNKERKKKKRAIRNERGESKELPLKKR